MNEPTKCKKCGKEIVFIRMKSGKMMPCDYPSEKRILEQDYIHLMMEQKGGIMVDTYVSHFATCPYAKDFRREKKT